MLQVVQGADEDKDHLLVERGDIIPDHEDDGTKLTGNRDGVLGVHLLVLIGDSFSDKVPVDHAGLDSSAQLDKDLTIAELSVGESLQRSLGLANLVTPGLEVVLSLASNDSKVMDSHELPDHREDVLLVTITDVLSTDTDALNTKSGHGFNCQVAVVILVEHVLDGHLGLGPVDAAFFNAVANTENDKTVTDLLKQVLNEAVLNLHGVDPEAESALFTGCVDVVIDQTSSLKFFCGELLKTVLGVENLSDEDRVDLLVTLAKIIGTNSVLNSHSLGASNHFGGSLNIVSLLKGIEGAVGAVKLVKNVDELFAILKIFTEVGNLLLASLSQVEVHPSNEDLFRLQLLKISKLLVVLEKTVDFFAFGKIDRLHGENANKLPKNTEHEMGGLVKESLSVDSNDLNQGLSDGEGLVKVLTHLVDVEVRSLVDSTHVNGVLVNMVEQMNQDHTVRASVEQIIVVGVDG